jgi:hypothetical protein
MNALAENPRARSGSNEAPDYAQEITDRMARDYAELEKSAADLLIEARALPEEVDDEATLKRFSDVVVRMRDTTGRAEGVRVAEKESFLRGGQAVDGFFNTIKARIEKGMGVLTKRVNAYQQRKLAEERERRRLEAEALVRFECAKREAEARLVREAEEKRRAAERARKPEQVEAKSAAAVAAEQAASDATVAAQLAADRAEAAHIDTLRKPSEMTRSRFDDGRLVTMKQVGYAEILDKMALDPVALWPFIKEEHALQALKAWAKTNSFKRPMAGAVIELRDESVIR